MVLHWASPWHGWLRHMSSMWHRSPGGQGGCEALQGRSKPPAVLLVPLSLAISTAPSLGPLSHLCVRVGRGRRRSPRGQCRWILGHRWQQYSHLGSLHSLCLPSRSHTRSGSCQPSSGTYHHFCSVGDQEPHIRPHLQSNPNLQGWVGRGQKLELGALRGGKARG